MIEDILQSAKQTLVERFSSPLLGAFLISWVVWNWKFLVILFSDASVTTTFDLVHRLAFPDWTAILLKGFAFPLMTSLAYVFLYPYPARFVYEFTLKRQREINEIKQRITNETPLTLERSTQLRAEFVARDRRSSEEIQRLNEEITSLKAALDSKPADSGSLSKTVHLNNELSPSEFSLLHLLSTSGGSANEFEIIKKSGIDRIKVEFDLGELLNRNLIERLTTATGRAIRFTQEGRRAFLNYKKSDGDT
ncbi:hypothetical protein [Limnohabitans sp.]|uniref:hypothetical protein n=1 Tax=Limnohabitans sp. TaxID=1907725 RepID=UPI0025B832A5|nr:hypothetical protein [Limnohabitans sp.]